MELYLSVSYFNRVDREPPLPKFRTWREIVGQFLSLGFMWAGAGFFSLAKRWWMADERVVSLMPENSDLFYYIWIKYLVDISRLSRVRSLFVYDSVTYMQKEEVNR